MTEVLEEEEEENEGDWDAPGDMEELAERQEVREVAGVREPLFVGVGRGDRVSCPTEGER